jgi:predicted phage terminase large subunit-like protein
MNSELELLNLLFEQRLRLARESFWEYCKLLYPDFYKDDRTYLKDYCNALQALYEKRIVWNAEHWDIISHEQKSALILGNVPHKVCDKLCISIPPRFGKSFTLQLFGQWVLGENQDEKILTISYNGDLAGKFSKTVRNGIEAEPKNFLDVVFNQVFPNVRLKRGSKAWNKWQLEGSKQENYRGTGYKGTLTGTGATIAIIDDLIKDADEAFNELALERLWEFYTGTFLSRIEKGGLQIINFTRWRNSDLIGRILESDTADDWYVIRMPAYDATTDTMLCDELLPKEKYIELQKTTNKLIFLANYQQETIDQEGRLYQSFKTYKQMPESFENIISYCDTADTGPDYLANIICGVKMGEAYVLDVIYTQEPQDKTENIVADALVNYKVNKALIESNNGGGTFARNVERIIYEKYKIRKSVDTFHQSNNKETRILVNSGFVENHIYFPENWSNRWPEFYKSMIGYQRQGNNIHDDAQDAITGIAETLSKGQCTKSATVYPKKPSSVLLRR